MKIKICALCETKISGIDINTTDDPMGGICLSVFVAGCLRRCPDCQNPHLQDFNAGKHISVSILIEDIRKRSSLIDAVSFVGGDFIYHIPYLIKLSQGIKEKFSLRTIFYTGEKFENIPSEALSYIDIVVDGEYKKEMPTNYVLPASSNQRVWIKDKNGVWKIKDPAELLINQI